MNFWERGNYSQNGDGRYSDGSQNPKNGNNRNSGVGSGFNDGANGGKAQGCSEQDIRDRVNEYSSKSEQQLMAELGALVNRMKSDGSFDPAAIENLYSTASPFLNDAQRERMRAIIDMIRG